MLNENFGKLAVDLSLEEKVMANGVLPGRTVPERSEVVTSMVHHLLNTGKWRKAVKLRFGEGRHLYDQTKGDFHSDLVKSVKPEDFEHAERFDGDCDIEFLLKHGQKPIVRDLAMREDLPPAVSEYLIRHAFDVEELSEKYNELGERIQKENPRHAFRLFSYANNKPAIERLYSQIIEDFKLEYLELASEMIRGAERIRGHGGSETSEKLKSLVGKALPLTEKEGKCGKQLYEILAREGFFGELSKKDMARLENLAVREMSLGDAGKRPFLELLWAQTNWEKNPVEAYKIFVDKQYKGKEVVQCAEKAFNAMFISKESALSSDKVLIQIDHLQHIFEKTPETDLNARESLAVLLSDKKELLRIGKIYAKSKDEHNLKKAYDLLVENGGNAEEAFTDDLRARLIEDTLSRADRQYGPFFSWLNHNDRRGFEQIYVALLPKWAGEAYRYAVNWKDEQRVARARDIILEKNPANWAIMFFMERKDKHGYERSLSALTKEYNVPAEQIVQLVGSLEK